MDILGTQKQQASALREAVIREQLKKLLPLDTELVDILFCARELNNQINSCRFDLQFKKN